MRTSARAPAWVFSLVILAACLTAVCSGASVAAPAGTPHLPDLQTVIPASSFSIVNGTDGKEFRYTHLVYNAGSGPLEIQPAYDTASGQYRGTQLVYTHNAAGTWSEVARYRVPDVFVFHAEHGHFHFPLASFGLYSVAQNGGIGTSVALSPKVGFCIDDSYIYNSQLEHAGTFIGTRSSCADPSGLRGLSVGGADEYDYRDPGQAIPFDGVPDGTYWFKATSDPNNDFVESDETNNETDVQVTVSNGTVTAGAVRHPDTTPPPGTLTAPTDGATVGGAAAPLSVTSTAAVAKVEFTVDGDPVATSTSTSNPYTATWDSTRVVDGTHYVAARITDTQGRLNTTNVSAVNVNTPVQPGGTFGLDGSTSVDGRGTQTTPTLAGLHGGDVLLAFVSSDGPEHSSQSSTVTGSGTSWSLVRRANTEAGTAEIWKAVLPSNASTGSATATPAAGGYDQSVTLSAFTGSLGIGASSASSAGTGAPSTSLTATAAGSWTWGVGNDWDGAAARTVGSSQAVRHQWVDNAVGDTFWVQSQTGRSSASGSTVTTNDTSPTNHRWNLASVEVVAADTTPPPPDTQAPTVSISDPHAGDIVSGIVALGATAADNVGVRDVTFSVDGSTIGTPDTAPPFMTTWDSRTVSAGSHTIRTVARDAAGNETTSAPVTVTVDNSAPPPAVIGIDKQVVVKAKGTLTAPALTTTSSGDEVLALVAMDGPNSARAQSATVSGGGLAWTLVKRANTQSGVSEIWAAKSTGKLTSAVVKATPVRSGYDGQLSVIALANAAGTNVAGAGGAPLGAPSIYLPGVAAGSWVFAVGNDWDRAVPRTPVSSQVLQQQWVESGSGDTFWVQSTSAPNIALSLVTIADSAPTNDQWNYAAVEVTAAPAA